MPIVTPDASGNGNFGKLIGGTVSQPARPALVASPFGAAFGNALQFDGVNRGANSQGVDCGPTSALTVTGPFCLEAKVRTGGSLVTTLSYIIAGRYSDYRNVGGTQPIVYAVGNQAGTAVVFVFLLRNSAGAVVTLYGTTALVANTNYTVAGTYDGTTMRLFVNGVMEASAPVAGLEAPDTTTRFLIGRDDDGAQPTSGGSPWLGVIDEVRLSKAFRYNANYTPTTTPYASDANTLGLWHLDTTSGVAPQPRVFRSTQTAPNAGTVRDLSATEGTATNSATSASFSGATGASTILLSPGNSAGSPVPSIPPQGAAAAGLGWKDVVAENPNEQITYAAGPWALNLRFVKNGQTLAVDITIRVTPILYWISPGGVSTEIIRFQNDLVVSTADYVLAFSNATGAPTVVAAGGKFQTEVYVQCLIAGNVAPPAAAVNIVCYTDVAVASTPAEFTTIPDYTIQFARTGSAAVVSGDAASRGVTSSRVSSDAYTDFAQSGPRVVTINRTAADVQTTAIATSLPSSMYLRTATETTRTVDTDSRLVTSSRTSADVLPTPVDTDRRVVTTSRTSTDATTQVDTAIRALTFGRTATHYFVPTDPAITVPSKRIQGVVRDSTGAPFLGGASVYLVRDSDNLICGMQTSSTVDGSYSFVRDQYDTNTYTVKGAATVNAMAEQDITRSGLVPV